MFTLPVFGPFQARANELLAENDHLPHKQQYAAYKIFEILQAEGYQGSESRVRLHFVATLVNDLLSAQQELKLSRFMAGVCKHDLLVLDEFGFIMGE